MTFTLEPDNRGRPDSELLADLVAVANLLGTRSPTIAKYNEMGRFSADTLKRRFGSWNGALRLAGLLPGLEQNVTRESFIADVRRVAAIHGGTALKRAEYEKYGSYSGGVAYRLFGSWDNAVKEAGLQPGWNTNIPDEALFDNLERVWRHLGRQPRMRDLAIAGSRYSADTYRDRFGGWRAALEAFVAAVNVLGSPPTPTPTERSLVPTSIPAQSLGTRRIARNPSWKLRFLTLRRDGYRCQACGRSPAKDPGVELEIDHVKPWSRGGETELDNLQSLCTKCNGGKSNLPENSQ